MAPGVWLGRTNASIAAAFVVAVACPCMAGSAAYLSPLAPLVSPADPAVRPGFLATAGVSRVHHAYLRRPAEIDPGTIHLAIANPTGAPLRVDSVMLNGLPLGALPDDQALWWCAVPPVAQPGQLTDLMVKLRWPTQRLIRASASLSDGETVEAVLEATPPPLRFSAIGYSEGYERVYLYLENIGEAPLSLTAVLVEAVDITRRCFVSERTIRSGAKALAVYTPEAPPAAGGYLTFTARRGTWGHDPVEGRPETRRSPWPRKEGADGTQADPVGRAVDRRHRAARVR